MSSQLDGSSSGMAGTPEFCCHRCSPQRREAAPVSIPESILSHGGGAGASAHQGRVRADRPCVMQGEDNDENRCSLRAPHAAPRAHRVREACTGFVQLTDLLPAS